MWMPAEIQQTCPHRPQLILQTTFSVPTATVSLVKGRLSDIFQSVKTSGQTNNVRQVRVSENT